MLTPDKGVTSSGWDTPCLNSRCTYCPPTLQHYDCIDKSKDASTYNNVLNLSKGPN